MTIIKASDKVRGIMKKKILLTFLIVSSECLLASPVYNFNFYNGETPEVVTPKKIDEKNSEAEQSADEAQVSEEEAQPKSTEGFIKATGKVVRGVKEILTPQNGPEFGLSYIVQDLQSSQTNYTYNSNYLSSYINSIGVNYLTAKKPGSVGRHRYGLLFSTKRADYSESSWGSDEYSYTTNGTVELSGLGITYDYAWYFPVSSGLLSHFIIEQGIALNYYTGKARAHGIYSNEANPSTADIQPENSSFASYEDIDDEMKIYSGTANLRAGLELAAAKLKLAGLIGLAYSQYHKETDILVDNFVKDSEFDVSLTFRMGLEL